MNERALSPGERAKFQGLPLPASAILLYDATFKRLFGTPHGSQATHSQCSPAHGGLGKPGTHPSLPDREIVVEYALRDSSKPMGVAQYRLSAALSDRLKRDLPTAEDLRQEFPSIAAMDVTREMEYSLRDFAAAHDVAAERPVILSSLLHELRKLGKAPPSTLAEPVRPQALFTS